MSKKIGIPRGFYFYEYGELYQKFFRELGFEVVISPKTNKEIIELGNKYAVSEMCLSMKIFLGHIASLKDTCDYIVLPRIDNYGISDQTCTNFLALYDIVNNLFSVSLLHYNIDYSKGEGEIEGFIRMGRELKIPVEEIIKVYEKSYDEIQKIKKQRIVKNINLLKDKNLKVLLVSHPYNMYDEMIGKPIIKYLHSLNVSIVYSDLFDHTTTNTYSKKISKDLYWKGSKENIGSIPIVEEKVDGVIFLSSFPCALDSLTYELTMRKIKIPYLHLVVDDLDALAGIETRIESFIDILEGKKYVY